MLENGYIYIKDSSWNAMYVYIWVSPVVKNLYAMQDPQEMQVQTLGWQDPQEEDTVTHSNVLP